MRGVFFYIACDFTQGGSIPFGVENRDGFFFAGQGAGIAIGTMAEKEYHRPEGGELLGQGDGCGVGVSRFRCRVGEDDPAVDKFCQTILRQHGEKKTQ